jgi:hypothetical protein
MGSYDPFGYSKHKLWPKKGQESNCQFESRTLKVKNRLDFHKCKWHTTYHWKALDEGYNFASDLILIEVLHIKLWAFKVIRVSILRISRQNDIWVHAMWLGTKNTIRGKVVASPKSMLWLIL